tara:strand:+ start:1297 stop:2334 length:1038 start_codon:yes stop_codon:yes gene_type:complete
MKVLVTGAAGFIGFHICKKLINNNITVIGLDNINDYYDTDLKLNRINELTKIASIQGIEFVFSKTDLIDFVEIKKIFEKSKETKAQISHVIHLAAQAGVRYSIDNPSEYIKSNLVGFFNIIEISKINKVECFLYASSSSVYGGNKKLPFEEKDNVDKPISLYAATKKSNELVAYSYSHLFNLQTIGLRFFTVYGPWGRPDMALFKFTKAIIDNEPIRVFNRGKMIRDFTFIDDVIESIFLLLKKSSIEDSMHKKDSSSFNYYPPYKIFNVGNSKPTKLNDYIKAIENNLGKKAKIILDDMQPGDVEATFADTKFLEEYINYKPNTSIEDGIKKFINWYLEYYFIK